MFYKLTQLISFGCQAISSAKSLIPHTGEIGKNKEKHGDDKKTVMCKKMVAKKKLQKVSRLMIMGGLLIKNCGMLLEGS